MMPWSSMQAITLTAPPQRPQTSISMEKTRFKRWVQVMPVKRAGSHRMTLHIGFPGSLRRFVNGMTLYVKIHYHWRHYPDSHSSKRPHTI